MTRCPSSSSTFRSVPMIFTELAPLTPERASSTLSRMYCEKLKLIPGNSLNFSISSLSMSSRLMVWSQSLWPNRVNGFFRHCSIGFERGSELQVEEAGRVGSVVGTAELGDDPVDLGNRADHLAQPRRDRGGVLPRDRPRHDGPNPQVSLFQRGHEDGAQVRDQVERPAKQRPHDRERQPAMPQHPAQSTQVAQLHDLVEQGVRAPPSC